MPMRGELAPPALRRSWPVNEDQLGWREIGGEVCNALGKLDPIIMAFASIGLLLTLCLMILDPSSAHITAGLAQEF
jgi:hypothetical protein